MPLRPARGIPGALTIPILWVILSVFLILPQAVFAQSPNVTYIYDELGRLKAVVDPAGDTAVYSYDSVGNLLSISRQSSSQVSIIEFTPDSGPVGATVTIYGTGFSTTPSQNTVTFNGTAATVTSSTATQIVTTVPSGAITGPISVTTPTGSATSSAPFTVTPSKAPTITSFTPTIGTPGTAVTITGTNFETTASNNKVTFNITHAMVSSATTTTINTSVPSQTGSGRISVATPYGKAVSTQDFFIPPSPYTAADVEVTGRMSIGESKTVTITTANKIALILFDGVAGQKVSLKISSVTISDSDVYIYNPDGMTLGSDTSVGTSGDFIDTKTLPATATYTILIDPASTYIGSMTLTLYDVVDVTGTITIGGPSVTVTTTVPGQNARLTFEGTAGQQVTLTMTGITFPNYTGANVYIYNPDGTTLASKGIDGRSDAAIDMQLPVTGTYTILIDPVNANTGSVTLTLEVTVP